MRRALCASALWAALCGASSAEAARFDFLGEIRTSTFVGVANAGQYGTGDDTGSCGADPGWDIGGETSATVAFLAHSKRFRHQLALSLGYSAQLCTPILRRPSFGFDYRGEHALSSRTRITGQARAGIDVFDRTLDTRSGQVGQVDPNLPSSSQSASGQFFITSSASVELQHSLSDRSALRAGLSWRALEILGSIDSLPIFSTLGPMQTLEASFALGRTWNRHRVEVPLRYRLSALYSSTFRDVLSRSEVKPAHDAFVGAAWEYKLDQRFTMRAETGFGIAAQPHLCVRLDPLLIAGDRCSIEDSCKFCTGGCSIGGCSSLVSGWPLPPRSRPIDSNSISLWKRSIRPRIGISSTGNSGLGMTVVNGASRLPRPPGTQRLLGFQIRAPGLAGSDPHRTPPGRRARDVGLPRLHHLQYPQRGPYQNRRNPGRKSHG